MADVPHREDNYLPEYIYQENLPQKDNFARFDHKGEWYFAYYQEEQMILRSEGYANEAGRDNGIESVVNHKDDNGNYTARMQPDGKWVLELRAKNNKEIARSCRFDDETAALHWLPSAIASRRKAKMEAAKHIPKGHVDDDYLRCKEYDGHPRTSEHSDFGTFEQDGEYYFVLYDRSGDVLLRSEGYKTESARDNGIESVIRNKPENDRYKIIERIGHYFVVLTAPNNKEIARSCPKTEVEALALIALLTGSGVAPKAPAIEDNYLACKKYEGHNKIESHDGFTAFEHEGEYYFALVKDDGEILLRSEGYQTATARDNGIASVEKNKSDKDRYRTEEHVGYHFVILTAPNHKEIARSCPKDEAGALALIAFLTMPPMYAEPVAAAAAAPLAAVPEAAGGGGVKWWWWLLLLLALLLIFLLWRGCNQGESTSANDGETVAATGPVYASEHDCAWEPILFGVDSDSITSEGQREISGVVGELRTNARYRALFIGFSDSTGDQEYNAQLSQRRADAAKAVAVRMGIPESRISTSEQDEHNPVATNRTEAGRKYNRRVVMYVLNTDNHLVCRQQELEVPQDVRE